MKGSEKVIEYLNKSLRHELTAVSQYWLHYRLLDDWGFGKLAAKEREESIEEMQHADKLIERIIFLEGHPNLQKLDPLMIGQNIKEVLECFSEKAQADTEAQTFITDEVLIKHGTPAEVIVETAQEQNCDLIVMGTYGHGTLTDVLVGSTAKWVIKNSPIPVLVIRLP